MTTPKKSSKINFLHFIHVEVSELNKWNVSIKIPASLKAFSLAFILSFYNTNSLDNVRTKSQRTWFFKQ